MKKVLFYILALSILAFFGNEGGLKLYKLHRFSQNVEQKNKSIEESNQQIREEIENMKNPVHVENHIRRTLGFVKENEKVYEFNQENNHVQ